MNMITFFLEELTVITLLIDEEQEVNTSKSKWVCETWGGGRKFEGEYAALF
jgi:hypothetical protein